MVFKIFMNKFETGKDQVDETTNGYTDLVSVKPGLATNAGVRSAQISGLKTHGDSFSLRVQTSLQTRCKCEDRCAICDYFGRINCRFCQATNLPLPARKRPNWKSLLKPYGFQWKSTRNPGWARFQVASYSGVGKPGSCWVAQIETDKNPGDDLDTVSETKPRLNCTEMKINELTSGWSSWINLPCEPRFWGL